MQATTSPRSVNLYQAGRQWASRPADQRFWSLEEAHRFSKGYADTAREVGIDFGQELLIPRGDDLVLTLDGGQGNEVARFTHWGFGQLARIAGAPAEYLRRLPADVAGRCIDVGLDQFFRDQSDMTCLALIHGGGELALRSLTSDSYSRFWNHQVFERLINLQADGWRVPPGRPVSADQPGARPATEADCLQDRQFGLSIKPGDMIAPAGIYASDHDMFAFMVNEQFRIDDGSDGGLSRGFFVSNSEVGAASLRVTLFHYRHVCGNHIVWDAKNVVEVSIRHVGDVGGRFTIEMAGALGAYLQSSAREDEERIRRAKTMLLGKTPEEVLDTVFKAVTKGRRNGLPSGLNQKTLAGAIEIATANEQTDGCPFSVWGYVNGLTRLSQSTPYQDERDFLDRSASAVLALAA